MSEIRLLHPRDIPQAVGLNEAAGWNQVAADWQRLIDLEPEGCFALDVGGQLAATATVVCFAQRLAWIGMVLTHPEQRRKGLARRMMECALRYADNRGVHWIKLDATDMGRPLYADLGFSDECLIERWAVVSPSRVEPAEIGEFNVDNDLDSAAFGADRSRILGRLAQAEAASLTHDGFAMVRPGRIAVSFGPCVSRTKKAARLLAQWCLSRHPGETVFWDLLPKNTAAVELAQGFGFERRRQLVRMARRANPEAPPLVFDNSLVYATAGFEYG